MVGMDYHWWRGNMKLAVSQFHTINNSKQVLSYVVLSQWNSEKKSLNAVHKRQLEATN